MPLNTPFIGDVVGSPRWKIESQVLPRLIPRWGIDLVVCNAKICRDVAGAIQEQMTHPGEVKVTVLRESRSVEFAR